MNLTRATRQKIQNDFGRVLFRTPLYYVGDYITIEIPGENYGITKNRFATNTNPAYISVNIGAGKYITAKLPSMDYHTIVETLKKLLTRRPKLRDKIMNANKDINSDELKEIQRRAGI